MCNEAKIFNNASCGIHHAFGGGHRRKMDIRWEGNGINEVGLYKKKEIIKIDKRYFRPTEVDELKGNSNKAFKKLGWEPKITLEELIGEMIEFDKLEAEKDSILKKKGFQINSQSNE